MFGVFLLQAGDLSFERCHPVLDLQDSFQKFLVTVHIVVKIWNVEIPDTVEEAEASIERHTVLAPITGCVVAGTGWSDCSQDFLQVQAMDHKNRRIRVQLNTNRPPREEKH